MTLQNFLSEWYGDDPRLLVHTSGSIGELKPLWVEKQHMFNSTRIICDFLGLKVGNIALFCIPLGYTAGKIVAVRSIERNLRLLNAILFEHPLSDHFLSETGIPDEEITSTAMVLLQVYNSLQVPKERECLRRIHHLIIGGSAVDDKLSIALQGFPSAVWSTYGMTGTLSHVVLWRLNGPNASGQYKPFDDVKV